MTISREVIVNIIKAGTLAPSGDNSQPWRFEVKDSTIALYKVAVPHLDHPRFNYQERGTWLALGAVIENMVIAASHYGLKATIDILPKKTPHDLVANILFSHATSTESTLFPSIAARCSNRKKYSNKIIPTESLEKLKSSVTKCNVEIVTKKSQIDLTSKLISEADRIALEDREIHRAFFDHIIWNKKQEESRREGLFLSTTELPLPVKIIFRLIRHWKIQKIANLLGFSHLAAFANAKTFQASSALIMLSTNGTSNQDFVIAGREMERFWLTATSLGLQMHPVTGLLYLMMKILDNKPSDLLPRHVFSLKKAYNELRDIYKFNTSIPFMLFRIGYAAKPSAQSTRKAPIISFIS